MDFFNFYKNKRDFKNPLNNFQKISFLINILIKIDIEIIKNTKIIADKICIISVLNIKYFDKKDCAPKRKK